ncbi:hypothetical protein [Streptomyces turgidiscabies]|uniref:Serine/threonine protein kinase n=1 Tax=Streptomyces turgidiscabies TaxID=85558 RepID=A0ABU0RQE0_9ACTN|nr:hypothetical protein [Streptomyces turgidiscabies]MDQ0934190.1 hypothetical protein [Streptomyces turgidiscabies]
MNDDELLARLKATDPALTSKAPRPDVPRLVEATMNTPTTPTPPTTSMTPTTTPAAAKGTAPRPRFVPAMAFTALLLVAGGGITWDVTRGGDGTAEKAAPPAATAAPHPHPHTGPLTLALPDSGSAAAKCVAPTPDLLRRHQLAFEGTVTAKQDDRVDLRVDHWYRATTGPADRPTGVSLTNDEANSEAPDFEIGAHYLVTADNGAVPMCGGTTEATDEARAMFREAF